MIDVRRQVEAAALLARLDHDDASRVRDALRLQRAASEAKKRPPIRVRTSLQPTFVRFVFEMPDGVGVSSVLNDQKLKLQFNSILSFDLADAQEASPPNIASIIQKVEGDTTAIEVALIGEVDVHSFREDKDYIVDVAFQQADKPSALSPLADAAVPAAAEKPAAEPAAPRQSVPATPGTAPQCDPVRAAESGRHRSRA